MKLYIAASLKDRELASKTRSQLEEISITVTSSWITEEPGIDSMSADPIGNPSLCREFARQDLDDIMEADAILYLDGSGIHSPGKHREFGFALANEMKIFAVGRLRSVFDFLPNVKTFDNVHSFLEWYLFHQEAIEFLIK